MKNDEGNMIAHLKLQQPDIHLRLMTPEASGMVAHARHFPYNLVTLLIVIVTSEQTTQRDESQGINNKTILNPLPESTHLSFSSLVSQCLEVFECITKAI